MRSGSPRPGRDALLVLLLLMPGPAPARAEEARITYVSGTTVFIDSGRENGLSVGQEIRVLRDGEILGILTVKNLASNRASCQTADTAIDFTIGDIVDFTPGPVASAAAATPAPTEEPEERGNWFRRNGIRGRVGFRYLSLVDQSGQGGRYDQPALDLRVDGRDVAGWLDMELDVRSRRTYRTRTGGDSETTGRTRIYQASLRYATEDGGSGVRVGRQSSFHLASVGTFDGILVDRSLGNLGAGGFVGFQPDPVDFGASSEIFEFGAFVRFERREGPSRLMASAGAVASRMRGDPNREYFFIRGQLAGSRLFGYASQEIDLNRGWKSEAGESAVSFTSTLLNLRYRLNEKLTLSGGFDNRRNIRLYHDYLTPEVEFDDAYRTGWSAGTDWEPAGGTRLGVQTRHSLGVDGEDGSASYTATTRFRGWLPWGIGVRTRHTRYDNAYVSGWLHTVGVGTDVGDRRHLELHAGTRSDTAETEHGRNGSIRWYGADLARGIHRSVYLLLSVEATRGDTESNDQILSSLSYRF